MVPAVVGGPDRIPNQSSHRALRVWGSKDLSLDYGGQLSVVRWGCLERQGARPRAMQ